MYWWHFHWRLSAARPSPSYYVLFSPPPSHKNIRDHGLLSYRSVEKMESLHDLVYSFQCLPWVWLQEATVTPHYWIQSQRLCSHACGNNRPYLPRKTPLSIPVVSSMLLQIDHRRKESSYQVFGGSTSFQKLYKVWKDKHWVQISYLLFCLVLLAHLFHLFHHLESPRNNQKHMARQLTYKCIDLLVLHHNFTFNIFEVTYRRTWWPRGAWWTTVTWNTLSTMRKR